MIGIEGTTGRALRVGHGRKNEVTIRVEEVDEIDLGNRKRKRQDSASPLSRLIRSCRRSSNH